MERRSPGSQSCARLITPSGLRIRAVVTSRFRFPPHLPFATTTMWTRDRHQACPTTPSPGFHKISPELESSTFEDTHTSKHRSTPANPVWNSLFSYHALKQAALASLPSLLVPQKLFNMLSMTTPTSPYIVTPTGRSMSYDSSMSMKSDTSLLLPEEGVVTVEGLRHCDLALNPK
jgi:hypothetical protein